MNLIGFITEYENGNLSEEEIVEGFQNLIDTGTVWTLQGHYGRTAVALIDAGHCTAAGGARSALGDERLLLEVDGPLL